MLEVAISLIVTLIGAITNLIDVENFSNPSDFITPPFGLFTLGFKKIYYSDLGYFWCCKRGNYVTIYEQKLLCVIRICKVDYYGDIESLRNRIKGEIELPMPFFTINDSKIDIYSKDANSLIKELSNKKEVGLNNDCSNYDFLRALCKKGFLNLNLKKNSKEYNEYANRIKYELEILNELGFVDYILLVWDVVNFCRENNISGVLGNHDSVLLRCNGYRSENRKGKH